MIHYDYDVVGTPTLFSTICAMSETFEVKAQVLNI